MSMTHTNCGRCGRELKSAHEHVYCNGCMWSNSIESSMKGLPDDQLEITLFAAIQELEMRGYEIYPEDDCFVVDKKLKVERNS